MRHKTFTHAPRLALNGYGEERELVPVSLPKLIWLETAAQGGDTKEAATRFAEYRAIRAGREAWQAINRAESFEGWRTIGAALAVGKAHALHVTGANRAWGQHYSRALPSPTCSKESYRSCRLRNAVAVTSRPPAPCDNIP